MLRFIYYSMYFFNTELDTNARSMLFNVICWCDFYKRPICTQVSHRCKRIVKFCLYSTFTVSNIQTRFQVFLLQYDERILLVCCVYTLLKTIPKTLGQNSRNSYRVFSSTRFYPHTSAFWEIFHKRTISQFNDQNFDFG